MQSISDIINKPKSKSIAIRDGFKYLLIRTGYATRLLKHVDSIKKNLKELCYTHDDYTCRCANNVLFVNETGYGNEITAISGTPEEISYIRNKVRGGDLAGSIAFRCASLSDAMRIANVLMQYKHCYGFDMSSLCRVEVDNDDILILEFDCESG